jgi:hypothetical protein
MFYDFERERERDTKPLELLLAIPGEETFPRRGSMLEDLVPISPSLQHRVTKAEWASQ